MLKRKRQVSDPLQLERYVARHSGTVEGTLISEAWDDNDGNVVDDVEERGKYTFLPDHETGGSKLAFRGDKFHPWTEPVEVSDEIIAMGAVSVISRHRIKPTPRQ